MLRATPWRQETITRFLDRLQDEQDVRIYCIFGRPGPLPIGTCRHPVLIGECVFDADKLKSMYLGGRDEDEPYVDSHSLLSDALLCQAVSDQLNDQVLHAMAPMLAQAAINPFQACSGDPERVLFDVVKRLQWSGFLTEGPPQSKSPFPCEVTSEGMGWFIGVLLSYWERARIAQ